MATKRDPVRYPSRFSFAHILRRHLWHRTPTQFRLAGVLDAARASCSNTWPTPGLAARLPTQATARLSEESDGSASPAGNSICCSTHAKVGSQRPEVWRVAFRGMLVLFSLMLVSPRGQCHHDQWTSGESGRHAGACQRVQVALCAARWINRRDQMVATTGTNSPRLPGSGTLVTAHHSDRGEPAVS